MLFDGRNISSNLPSRSNLNLRSLQNGALNLTLKYKMNKFIFLAAFTAVSLNAAKCDTSGLQRGCDAGDLESCDNLGLAYIGVKLEECDLDKNYEKAFALFKKACDGEYVRACVNLGVAYRKGEGVKKDEPKAVLLYKKACDSGYLLGCANLGSLYEQGLGVKKDAQKAGEIWRKACEAKDGMSCFNLGVLYYNAMLGKKDVTSAKNYLQKACAYGWKDGCEAANAIEKAAKR